MISPSLLNRTVTIHHLTTGTGKGTYGSPARTDKTTATRGRLSTPKGRELRTGTDLAVTSLVLFLLPTESIGLKDHVVIDGQPYEAGQPQVIYDADSPHHIEVPVEAVNA